MMVPMCMVGEFDRAAAARRREAERQVRAKFPALLEGSSGWHRAVASRYDRVHLAHATKEVTRDGNRR